MKATGGAGDEVFLTLSEVKAGKVAGTPDIVVTGDGRRWQLVSRFAGDFVAIPLPVRDAIA